MDTRFNEVYVVENTSFRFLYFFHIFPVREGYLLLASKFLYIYHIGAMQWYIVLWSFYPLCKINNLSDKSFVIKLSLFNHIQNSVQSLGVFKPAVEALQGNVLFVIFIFISSFFEFASREETFDAENKRKNQFQFDKFSKELYFIAPCPSCAVSSFTSEIVGRFICFLALLNLPLKIKCTPSYINAK